MSMTWEDAELASVDRATMLQAIADLKSDLESKFDQIREDRDVYVREVRSALDKITEHVNDHRVRIATEEEKIRYLESHVYGRRQSDKQESTDDSAPAITMGDFKRMGIFITVATAIGAFGSKLWAWLHTIK